LITRVEAAGPQELAEMLVRPSPEEERVLRTHLGEAQFERMRTLVLQSSLTRAGRTTQGNVVVLHGIMGGELTYYETDAHPDPIWLKIFRLTTRGPVRHVSRQLAFSNATTESCYYR
jgi:hypothetical protein